jgi:hypothetical protein
LRAIAQYRDYGGPTAREEKKMTLATGQEQILQKLVMAGPFNWGMISDYEFQKALEHWPSLKGLAEGESIRARFSVFDSTLAQSINGWTDEETELAIKALQEGPGAGTDYIILEEVKAPAPWPAYDKLRVQGKRTVEMVAEKIAATVTDLEIDPDAVLVYERENQNRPEVVAAVEALKAEEPAEELIEA